MRWPDRILVLLTLVLLVLGPVMAVQEWALLEELQTERELFGRATTVDMSFRDMWRLVLFVVVLAVGVLGTWMALRVAARPRVRAVSGRLVGLLLAGLALLDLAFYADVNLLLQSGLGVRAAAVAWMYPLVAILIAGSVLRLSEVEEAFSRTPASLVETPLA